MQFAIWNVCWSLSMPLEQMANFLNAASKNDVGQSVLGCVKWVFISDSCTSLELKVREKLLKYLTAADF